MAGPQHHRLCEIRCPGESYGTGYALSAQLVLTAAHVIGDSGKELATDLQITLRLFANNRDPDDADGWQPAQLAWPLPADWIALSGFDIAILRIAPGKLSQAEADKVPTGWEDLPTDRLLDVTAAGFPRLRRDPKTRFRDVQQIFGKIEPLTAVGRSVFEIKDTKRDKIKDADWHGFSGAALFAEGNLIGVVRTKVRENDLVDFKAVRVDAPRTKHPEYWSLLQDGPDRADLALDTYRTSRINEWSHRRHGVADELFTQLSLLLDRGQEGQERWAPQKRDFDSLAAILKDQPEYAALVLLGDPGAGKSTLLRKLDLDIARENQLAGGRGRFSYFVSLRDYRGAPGAAPPEPMQWLCGKWTKEWQDRLPDLADLEDLLTGDSYLLLDALNEMPLGPGAEYQTLVDGWTAFIATVKTRFPKCRMVFSCRSLEYSTSLSNPEIQVPHVEIKNLDEQTIRKFLEHYAPQNAQVLFRAIKAAGHVELYGNAYFLKMLCDQAGGTGQIPQDRSALFTAFIRKLLHRELDKRTLPKGLLDETDRSRVARLFEMEDPPWRSPYELPMRGPLFSQLSWFAHAMQARIRTADNSEEVVAHDEAVQMLTPALGQDRAGQLIQAACALGVLDHDPLAESVRFMHQLMREYFAARHLAHTPELDRVRAAWRKSEVRPNLDEALTGLNINEPLPILESTGWEEATLLAAAMAPDRAPFFGGLIESNLPLAGRAAAQILASDVQSEAFDRAKRPTLSAELIEHIATDLLARMADPTGDLRARIAAGKALGEMGDPRLIRKLECLLPPVIRIPAGRHQIGSNDFHRHERPKHTVWLGDFCIAQFPVTNAEWDRFIQAAGYEDERWWKTRAGKQWRCGETTRAARDAQWRSFRNMLKRNPDYIERKLKTGELSPKEAAEHYKARDLSDKEFENTLQRDFEESLREGQAHARYTEPRRWRNKDFNNPLQPVVGICWYEAQAYCAWLSAQTGQSWRLPTEAEWEAAARFGCAESAEYPWGTEFSRERCNTFETHVRAPTPVGIFPSGATAADLIDMCGNVYEWTSSKYNKAKYPYPYSKDDGRESPEDVEDPREYEPRVLRGGSWYYSRDEARIAFRLGFHPGYHNQSTGLRLALDA